MSDKCLYCYQPLRDGERDFHQRCSSRIFGTAEAPRLPYTHADINELATQVVRARSSVTGVQPKLSVDFDRMSNRPDRLTIVGLWGQFILKPQTDNYPHLPELEDVCMHLAQVAGINTVPHSLIRFADGELCYITRRIDRTGTGRKLPMEDMCQLSMLMTEDKYHSSHERIAKLIDKYSSVPRLDIIRYWAQVLFSWVIGNADMHLKNYSIYSKDDKEFTLAPAYDLLSTAIVLPSDNEELALTVSGRKRKLTRLNFTQAMTASGIIPKVQTNIINRLTRSVSAWRAIISQSFLPETMRLQLTAIINDRMARLAD